MIDLHVSITNPFYKSNKIAHKQFYYKNKKLSKNKSFEIEIVKTDLHDLFYFSLDLGWWGSDHAGPKLHINILSFNFSVSIYDHRHWDYENNRWEIYPGEMSESKSIEW